MKKFSYIIICLFLSSMAIGQSPLSVTVSNDSILIGNRCTITFILENVQGDFEAPTFEGVRVVSGPNTSSSFQSVNGKSTSRISYSYIVEPTDLGEVIIDQAFLVTENETLETDFIKLNVYPNPDGIIQNENENANDFFFSFPPRDFATPEMKREKPTKKKYKLKKI